MKAYRTIPINECGEPLVAIPPDDFRFFEPHPYVAAGAPYDGKSPWMLRQGVLNALQRVRKRLEILRPSWRIKLFDAYRPHTVQAYMVEHEFRAQSGNRPSSEVEENERKAIYEKVFRIWAIPSNDPATPPPHSTGAVFDCTLADSSGNDANMGSPIDENSNRSLPDYFANATDPKGREAHDNRSFLYDILRAENFRRHPEEWWHFSTGDQIWAWQERDCGASTDVVARYGRADLVK